jgi:hypothetical protein
VLFVVKIIGTAIFNDFLFEPLAENYSFVYDHYTMKTNIILKLVLLVLFAIVAVSCGVKKIEFVNEILDLGEKEEGIKFEAFFELKNTGTDSIKITDVKPGCTCVSFHDWDMVLKPGESGKIPFTFNTAELSGEVTRTGEAYTDVPDREKILLSMHVKIRNPLVTVSPKVNFVGEVNFDTKQLKGISMLINNLGTPLKIVKVIPPSGIKSTYELNPLKNEMFEFAFTLYPPYSGKELVQNSFTLMTNNEKIPAIDLAFTYRVLPAIEVFPKVLQIDPESTEGKNFVTNIFIRNNSQQEIDVQDFAIENGEGFVAETNEILKNVSYKISITLPKDYQFNAGKKTIVSFRVKNDPDRILYSIPIEPKSVK